MKGNIFFLLIIAISFSAKNLFAQNVSATWQLTSTTQAAVVTSGAVSAQNQLITGLAINGWAGNNTAAKLYSITGGTTQTGYWPNETAKNDNRFAEYKIIPSPGVSINIITISLSIGNSGGSNNLRADLYFSSDNFVTSTKLDSTLFLKNSGMDSKSYSINATANENQSITFRVYPWATNGGAASGKYANIQNVILSGTSTGDVIVSLPVVSTNTPTNISTTSAISGGTISSDGGGAISARGVCWNLTGNPTITDNKTSDSSGIGSFVSSLANLTVNTKYFIRAYAINSAGAAYGKLDSLTTLASLTTPTVTTTAVSNVMVYTATSGGEVTSWGGTDVIARGVCWNLTGNPTITDNKTSDGVGLGKFSSAITDLTKNTKYYLRAYATNAQGTNYGVEINFTTQSPAPDVKKIVSKDGSGDYTTVQAAFNGVPDNYTGTYTIFVKDGTYKEKLSLAANKVNVILEGESRDNTILTYDDYAGKPGLGTSSSQSVAIDASDFTAKNITFQNTVKNDGSFANQQAVALRANGDRQIYLNCKILGYQDTYYTYGAVRIYNKNCYIEGSVDFIFGKAIAVFDNCTINVNRNGGVLTAASTNIGLKFGYIFLNCTLTTNSIGFDGIQITSFYLGRPWQNEPQTVFINCVEPSTLHPAGWTTMQVNAKLYAEYNCTGPGSNYSQRVSFSRQLTSQEAAQYTIENIFSKNSGIGADNWVPEIPTSVEVQSEQIPNSYKLSQNYPNPFNPTTIISYRLPVSSNVQLKIYDMLGREIITLVDKFQNAGVYNLTFNTNNSLLSSGIYFYTIKTGSFLQTRKMILLK